MSDTSSAYALKHHVHMLHHGNGYETVAARRAVWTALTDAANAAGTTYVYSCAAYAGAFTKVPHTMSVNPATYPRLGREMLHALVPDVIASSNTLHNIASGQSPPVHRSDRDRLANRVRLTLEHQGCYEATAEELVAIAYHGVALLAASVYTAETGHNARPAHSHAAPGTHTPTAGVHRRAAHVAA